MPGKNVPRVVIMMISEPTRDASRTNVVLELLNQCADGSQFLKSKTQQDCSGISTNTLLVTIKAKS